MNFSYPPVEKLKGKNIIDLLFSQGNSVAKYPLRLVYVPIVTDDQQKIKIGVSVPKKHFKKAVDRNYYKRVLRECYRQNKHLLIDNLTQPHAFMLLYQSKERLTFEERFARTKELFLKFASQKNQNPKR